MCDVRSIVVDLKSTLDLKGANHQRQPIQHKQQQQSQSHKQQRRKTTIGINSQKTNKLISSLNRPTTSLLEKKQLEMLKRINKTIEQLSNKVVSVEKEQQLEQSSSNSLFRHHSPVGAPISFCSVENDLNSIKQNKVEKGLTPRLEQLNKQVNRIQNSVAATHSTPSPKYHLNNNEYESSSMLQHQSSLVKNLENKLDDLETRLDNKNNKDKGFCKKHSCSPLPEKPILPSTKYIERY